MSYSSLKSISQTLLALVAAGCSDANQYVPPPPPAVSVAQPVERNVVRQLEFTGTARATEAVDVRARVNGYLQNIEFADGADVKQGDLLFIIEPAPFEAALDSAKAALQKAEAMLSLAEADLRRTEPLVERGALTEQELDVKKADVATAKADVASAKAALVQAELNLSYTKVRAPISGRASRHMVDVGNLVQAEKTILTRLEAFDPIHAYFAVSESDVMEFMKSSVSTSAESLRNNPLRLYLGLNGEQGFPHKGRLDFAEAGVDPQTGTQMRRGVFSNTDKSLAPGMFVRLRLSIGNPQPSLMIPDRAIAVDQRGEYALTVNDKNIVEYRPVKLGMRIAEMRVVDEGLQPNDWVVVNGLQRARPGASVSPEKMALTPEAERLNATHDPAVAAPAAAQAPAANSDATADATADGGD